MVKADQCRGRLPSKVICDTPYAIFRRVRHLTGSSLYATTRTDLTSSFGRSPLGITSCRITTLNLLHTDFCTDCKAVVYPAFLASLVFVLPPSLLLYVPSPTSGLIFEYIPGVSMSKPKPGVDVSEQEAERISSQVMEALRAIEAENCVLHNDIHIGSVILQEKSRSPVIIDFGQGDIREPELSDEEWWCAVRGAPDTRYMRRLLVNPENGPWKRTVTPYKMSNLHYKEPLVFNRYVESMPEDFRRETFERVLDTDWEGAREKVYQWRIRPGVRCRPRYDYD